MNFDAHCDIWTDITRHYLEGEHDIFRKYHYERLKKGGVEGGIFAIWNDNPDVGDPVSRTKEMQTAIKQEEPECADILVVARCFDDIVKAKEAGKMYCLTGHEGLESIGEDIDLLEEYYKLGARHAMLTWNEENLLATGTRGTADRGLTELGKRAVHKLEDLHMIVDVSHLNETSFWDLMRTANGPVVASHSNCKALCDHVRNLTDDQLRELGKSGGVVGINSWNELVDKTPAEQTVAKLVEHVSHMVDIMGIDHVGFGFDFCEFLSAESLGSFSTQDTPYTIGLEDASQIGNVVAQLQRVGFNQEEVDKITHKNWLRLIKEIIG